MTGDQATVKKIMSGSGSFSLWCLLGDLQVPRVTHRTGLFLWNPSLDPFGLCSHCTFFLICHFAKHCLLLPLAPDLSSSVLVSHWWLWSRVKAAEKKETRDLAFSRWLECQLCRAPGNLLLFSPVVLDLSWFWADRPQLTEHKPRLGGSPRVCLALAAANGEAACQGRHLHIFVWRQGDTVHHLGEAATNLIPSDQSRELAAANQLTT